MPRAGKGRSLPLPRRSGSLPRRRSFSPPGRRRKTLAGSLAAPISSPAQDIHPLLPSNPPRAAPALAKRDQHFGGGLRVAGAQVEDAGPLKLRAQCLKQRRIREPRREPVGVLHVEDCRAVGSEGISGRGCASADVGGACVRAPAFDKPRHIEHASVGKHAGELRAAVRRELRIVVTPVRAIEPLRDRKSNSACDSASRSLICALIPVGREADRPPDRRGSVLRAPHQSRRDRPAAGNRPHDGGRHAGAETHGVCRDQRMSSSPRSIVARASTAPMTRSRRLVAGDRGLQHAREGAVLDKLAHRRGLTALRQRLGRGQRAVARRIGAIRRRPRRRSTLSPRSRASSFESRRISASVQSTASLARAATRCISWSVFSASRLASGSGSSWLRIATSRAAFNRLIGGKRAEVDGRDGIRVPLDREHLAVGTERKHRRIAPGTAPRRQHAILRVDRSTRPARRRPRPGYRWQRAGDRRRGEEGGTVESLPRPGALRLREACDAAIRIGDDERAVGAEYGGLRIGLSRRCFAAAARSPRRAAPCR